MKGFLINIILCCFVEVLTGVFVPDGAVRSCVLSVVSLLLLHVILEMFFSILKIEYFI